MEIDINRVLSKEMVGIVEKHGFKITATQDNDNVILTGGIHFQISANSLPKVPNPYNDKFMEDYNIFQDNDGNGPIIYINMFNRNKTNHDFSVAYIMRQILENIDTSVVTMNFIDLNGHGLYGMPKDMRDTYNEIEKVMVRASKLVMELSEKITK